MTTTTGTDRLHFTGDDEADRLLVSEPMALIIGFALDQQVPVQKAFSGPKVLLDRLGTLDPGAGGDGRADLDAAQGPPAIHRFPVRWEAGQELAGIGEPTTAMRPPLDRCGRCARSKTHRRASRFGR